jgi:hypothetical protein
MTPTLLALSTTLALLGPALVGATDPLSGSSLGALSDSVEALARRVHPGVVTIAVAGLSDSNEDGATAGVVTRGQGSGSKVVIEGWSSTRMDRL